MLDNEPDTNTPTRDDAEQPSAMTPPPEPPARAPRRRRAATRPAGPPSTAPDAPPIASTVAPPQDAPAPEAPAEPLPADAPPAKRAAAKRTAKKAADPDAPPRTPRKRAAKKAVPVAAEDSVDDLAAPEEHPVTVTPPEVVEPTADEAEPPAEAGLPDVATEPAEADDGSEAAEVSDAPPVPEAPEAGEGPTSIAEAVAELLGTAVDTDPDAIESDTESDDGDTDETESDDSDADDADDSDAEDSEAQAREGDGSRRRRRRRGGRRRRRTGDAEDGDDTAESPESGSGEEDSESEAPAEAAESSEESDSDAETDSDGESEGQRRRRRRRRRRGEEAGSAPDDPTEVVVRVREPRRAAKVNNEVTGIEGSTRMEAKRQRRRDGREAGRRRPPILSEAEFLARREAVRRTMIVRQREDPSAGSGETLAQIAVLEDDILVEHYVDREAATSLIGNVYLGRVQNVLPSMEAAFIDIGRGRNAVLYAGEVDWDAFGAEGQNRKVEKVLKSGQTVLVQVTKDPVGSKGARLTNHVSIPGRYIVYAPGGHLSGISRKLPDVERKRLKDILADLVGEAASVIVRTAAEGASEEELVRDVNRLKAQWADIEKKVASGSAPQLLYGEPDLTVRIVRDLFTEDFAELIIAGSGGPNDAYDAVEAYVTHVAPHLADRLRKWDEEQGDVFAAYRLDEQIAKALERKVFLPSGGSLVIDRTEAMTVIDVNTGKFTGSGGNLEATVTSNNLEAAEEIVRQLRLRDIGGIIVIDFIDMVLPSNRELLLRRLVECLGRDRTRHQVAEVTSLGLVQMTRKKIGTGLLEAFTTECPHCNGRGVELHELPVETQKQADGGTREYRSRDRHGGSPTHKTSDLHPPASNGHRDDSSDDRGRGRRGGRNRRGGAPEVERAEVEPREVEPDATEADVIEPAQTESTEVEAAAIETPAPETPVIETPAVEGAEHAPAEAVETEPAPAN